MLQYLSVNPFTDSDSPWYYVVGVVCLLLVFAALAVYLVVSSKKKKKQQAAEEQQKVETNEAEKSEETEKPIEEDKAEQPKETDEPAIESVEEQKPEETTEAEEQKSEEVPVEPEEKQSETQPETKSEPKKAAPKKVAPKKTDAESAEKPTEQKASPKKTTANKPQNAESNGEAAPKKPKTTKTEKPFIDKIIAAKAMHGVYNEVKNTILSYPGIKAKLTKDEELFLFGQDKKASISLDGTKFMLKLDIDPQKVPSQFNITAADGELPTTLAVEESKIDNAQKLITFAMNVALLTRNDRHRHTDYVQNAINAKNRNKNK